MTQAPHPHTDSGTAQLRVLIAGGGVAGLETAFALREVGGDRATIRILAPTDEFVYRPLSIGEPFTSGHARRYSLAKLAADAGAELIHGELSQVDAAGRKVTTRDGTTLSYDALVVCPGAIMRQPYEHTTPFDDARLDELLHGLVQDVEQGYVRQLAIVVPAPMPWPLPAYELALMASERAWDMRAEMDVTVFTPETAPLAAFGAQASHQLSRLLAERRIDVVTAAYCEIPRGQTIVVHPGGRVVHADRIVSLPALCGPGINGLPQDGNGFIPIDEYGRVSGLDSVWAAGDATDYPLKQGGVAAQLADTVACGIAAAAGAQVQPLAFAPALHGVLLTGGRPRYLRGRTPGAATDTSSVTELARDEQPPKIAARFLTPHLTEELPQAPISR
jgi:sulfide:quinone oxidoreductase